MNDETRQSSLKKKELKKMTDEKYNRLKITTKKGLIFEIILADLKEGDYDFGKVEVIDTLNIEQGEDYINVIENLLEITDGENNKSASI